MIEKDAIVCTWCGAPIFKHSTSNLWVHEGSNMRSCGERSSGMGNRFAWPSGGFFISNTDEKNIFEPERVYVVTGVLVGGEGLVDVIGVYPDLTRAEACGFRCLTSHTEQFEDVNIVERILND